MKSPYAHWTIPVQRLGSSRLSALVVWQNGDFTTTDYPNRGRLFDPAGAPVGDDADGFESGDAAAWSAAVD